MTSPLRFAWLAALILAGCGSSATKTVTATSSSASASSTTQPAPAATTASSSAPGVPALHLTTFKSPSGNIGCDIAAGTARCDIKQRSWSPPPRPPGCPPEVDFGQGLEIVGAGHGQFVCAGDTALDPTAQSLPYGQDTEAGPFRCLSSATTGMFCANTRTGHGFNISIQGYRTF